jgi:hypothetical protein
MNNRYIVDETIAVLAETEYKHSIAESSSEIRKFDLDPLYQALEKGELLRGMISKDEVIDILFSFTGAWGRSEIDEIASADISADIIDMALVLEEKGFLVED